MVVPMNSDIRLQERCNRLENQISTLKHVSSLRKNLLELRERQVKDLISKMKFYEILVTEERESRHSLSSRLEIAETQCTDLNEKLTQNVHTTDEMKVNYENKVSTLINELQTSEQRNQQLSDQLNCAQLRISEVTQEFTLEALNKKLEEKDRFANEMQKQMKRVWERNKMLSYQMGLLNNLFNETEGVTIDFEKIKAIGDIVRESQTYTDGSADEEIITETFDITDERRPSVDLENLLDSIEKSEKVIPAEIPGEESCYKRVDTKRGPQLVLSVSQTFIKLKDLIVEKKSLQKEIDTLKTLNTKLESKVDKQEHRLYRVTLELNKTWSLVSKLKQQHKRLYNSEAVLRYELQEKRVLLEKLKNELSNSREKWRRVRQKNSQSQIEWEKLRDEFALRKHQSSQESGTFSEVMSVSSGDNDVTLEEEAEDAMKRRNQNNGTNDRPKTLPLPFAPVSSSNDTDGVSNQGELEEDGPEEESDGACALSPEPPDEEQIDSEDPLEDLVSQLVEDIENEADTEEESSCRTPPANDSSPSPDFEDRMRRRASKLQMLEEQCHVLHTKLLASTERSEALSSKLAHLHDHYGPSGSSTEAPSDELNQLDASDDSPIQEGIVNNFEEDGCTSTSTDAAYVSGAEMENTSDTSPTTTVPEEHRPELVLQTASVSNSHAVNASRREDLINSSENRNVIVTSAPLSDDNTPIPVLLVATYPQGQLNAERSSVMITDPPHVEQNSQEEQISIISPSVQVSISASQDFENNDNAVNRDITQYEMFPVHISSEAEQQQLLTLQPTQLNVHVEQAPYYDDMEHVETLPIHDTAVLQHFPVTEEEANEFVPVQIRPEFLRLLQEADEATTANSLDWMPNLLTITHNIALLRLDPELPSASTTNPRSLSESLRIEIPQFSPSPPPVLIAATALEASSNHRFQNYSDPNEGSHSSDAGPNEGDEQLAYKKDPSFLSRLIIKQLPKRLQILKNENHTLLMEAAETKMRMKEIKRKLSKELERSHELAVCLDGQIEDKNLVEFELREELEKKEKVIEDLQMEIDQSRDYVDELKKEKDETEVHFKILLEEKVDLDQPKVPAESVKNCHNCKRAFTLITRRKYHCKICGRVFCKDCAIHREPNKRSLKRLRLCTLCHLRRQRLVCLVHTTKQLEK